MFRYCDKNGNVFELFEEGQRLVFSAQTETEGLKSQANATAAAKLEKRLDASAYMELVSAFSAAIDNKVFHRELCNRCSGIILTTDDGQQRRYILSEQSVERGALEAVLARCLGSQPA